MATIVSDCPRCDAKKMTFDIIADVWVGSEHGWSHVHEITARCRRCQRPSLLIVRLHDYDLRGQFGKDGQITNLKNDIISAFKFVRNVSHADITSAPAPESIPENIRAIFEEGSRCLAVNCPNAAGGMFRLCLDLATKAMLPSVDQSSGPDSHQRRNLAPRLRWLFETGKLAHDLKDLSTAVKENGDDGAHDGSLTSSDAEDLYDFAYALLSRIYSEPARLAAMADRRRARRESPIKN